MKPCRRFLVLLWALLPCACGAPADSPGSEPYAVVADVQQLMLTVVEPGAEEYWDAVGWILDEAGTTEIYPRTEEEWERVRNAGFVIAESGNLLMMPGRAPDDEAWTPMAQALVEVGRAAIAAAEAKDPQAVFDAGAEVYYVCTNCHAAFALETLRPSDDRAN